MRMRETLGRLPEVDVLNPQQKPHSRVIDPMSSLQEGISASGFTAHDAQRFWAKVDRGAECWNWVGAKLGRDGYGGFSVARGKPRGQQAPRYAHRVSYALAFGVIPPRLSVLHRCDNRACVNPGHLFLGTQADNNRDAASKGRLSTPRPSSRKVNDEQIAEMFALRKAGLTFQAIGDSFGVTKGFACRVINGKARVYTAPQLRKAS